MRLRFFAVPAVAAVACAAAFMVPAAASTAGWGNAIQVPGTAALNTADKAAVTAVSCPSAGNCVAGGYYTPGTGGNAPSSPFVAAEVNGTWHNASAVPGLPSSWHGEVTAISCASAGNCTIALGVNADSGVLVDNEVNGVWQKAVQLPGISQLATGGGAHISTVSCGAPGDCSVGGSYAISSGFSRAFLATEVKGVWGKAFHVAGTDGGGDANIDKISCRSAGNCSASGGTNLAIGPTVPPSQAFVVDEVNGTWQKAIFVPGLSALKAVDSEAYSVSCGAAGECSATGYYIQNNTGIHAAFVANEVHGTWHAAAEVPGFSALNTGDSGEAYDISCAKPGDCSVTGQYADGATATQEGFVASEVNGTWQKAIEIPGIVKLDHGIYAQGTTISCASPGNCSAAGSYSPTASLTHSYAFLADQVNGTWQNAIAVPGLAVLAHGTDTGAAQVSCGAPGNCVMGGSYGTPTPNTSQAFVVARR